jgi:hypothetical protein
LPNLLERINSKILLKITLLVIIEIILIVGSFGVLAYFQSQESSLGISINIAGKNRYLTSDLLLETEKYLDGTSDASQLKAAMDGLQSNIIALKQGGMISGVDLKPLRIFSTSGILLIELGIFTKLLLLKYCHINRSKQQQHHQH